MTSNLFLFAAFVVSMLLMSANYKKRRTKIVFFGEVDTGSGTGFGSLLWFLKNLMQEDGLDDDFELKVDSVQGDQIYDLYLRLDDLLYEGPDIVVITSGANDVRLKWSNGTGTDIERFRTFYIAILEKLSAAAIKVVLCTPATKAVTAVAAAKAGIEIDEYSDLIRSLAGEYALPLVDGRKVFLLQGPLFISQETQEGLMEDGKRILNSKVSQIVADQMWQVLKSIKK